MAKKVFVERRKLFTGKNEPGIKEGNKEMLGLDYMQQRHGR